MDTRIQVFETEKIKNEIGEEKEVNTVLCIPWAKVVEIAGGEETEGKILHRIQRNFIIRWRGEINQKSNQLKLDYQGRIYFVSHVKQIGRREFLELQTFVNE
ncbi:head-tail adaptor protein [Myroides sp. JBRI-B21084]|uniref:phage head completion protein n=1 Tax=Myroides sp. JBRI-B21084 TaxID=3119977 RepID=UPI0026E30887|nr:head-tail adaptor protein [Paenimyroides cloacae]WKW47264.1 head-tail adaptor protein [Paenimyroides cloacae]